MLKLRGFYLKSRNKKRDAEGRIITTRIWVHIDTCSEVEESVCTMKHPRLYSGTRMDQHNKYYYHTNHWWRLSESGHLHRFGALKFVMQLIRYPESKMSMFARKRAKRDYEECQHGMVGT